MSDILTKFEGIYPLSLKLSYTLSLKLSYRLSLKMSPTPTKSEAVL